MSLVKKILSDFISHPRDYKLKIGHLNASGLSGFIAGVILASTLWFCAYYIRYFL